MHKNNLEQEETHEMGANWSEYTETELKNLHNDDANFTCYVCTKQKNELRVCSMACNHVSCVDCLSTSSFLGQNSLTSLKDYHHDTVISYYPPTKGMFRIPGLCSVCFVENAIKSPNFHESSFYFKRKSGNSVENAVDANKSVNTKVI